MYEQVYTCICIHLLSNTVTYQEKTSWLLVKWTMAEEQSRWTCNLCQYTWIQKTVSSCCFSPQISPLQTYHNTHAPQRIVHNAVTQSVMLKTPCSAIKGDILSFPILEHILPVTCATHFSVESWHPAAAKLLKSLYTFSGLYLPAGGSVLPLQMQPCCKN